MRALDIKVFRDLWRLQAQLVAIALVLACGVGLFVGMRSTMSALETARSSYYAKQRFAHVFASLKRAPEGVADQLRAIPGVQRLQTRVVGLVTVDMPGMVAAATVRLESIPDHGQPQVNGLHLRRGRLPEPLRNHEVVVSEGFAQAHQLQLSAEFNTVIRGRRERLRVVGVALSPEHTYSLPPAALLPDDRRYGVFWMRRAALAPALELDRAFNDVVLQVDQDAVKMDVVRRIDQVLDRHGGRGAILQKDQPSAFFVENELAQLSTLGTALPALFMLVSAFLLQVVIGRIVIGQRQQIATVKAVGYRDLELVRHYSKIVAAVVVVGLVLGLMLAAWIGSAMTGLYLQYYRFPSLPFAIAPREAVFAALLAALAACAGTFTAVRAVLLLPPAEAMRPPSPAVYRRTLLERLHLTRFVPIPARIVLREIERSRLRALLSILGIALATALVVVSRFSFDSIQHVMHAQFNLAERQDVTLALSEPRATTALETWRSLPGVFRAEPVRTVPVEFRSGPIRRTAAITGLPADAILKRVLTTDLVPIPMPPEGLVLSRALAGALAVKAGDTVEVAVLEGRRHVRRLPVARLAETYVGLSAWMELEALCRLLGQTTTASEVLLSVERDRMTDLHHAVKELPMVAGVHARLDVMERFRAIVDEHVGTTMMISLGFALVLALGVLYNAARITLAERANELASLRVLGFRRRETAAILLGEILIFVLVAVPLGLLLGRLFAAALVAAPGFSNEQFRFPLVISPATDMTAILTILAAAAFASHAAWRRLDRIDIVEVLKARD